VASILGHLQRLERQQALALVLPPPSREEATWRLTAVSLPAADPILEWFSCWGGRTSGGELGKIDVLPGFYALSLADAVAHRHAYPQWPDSWLPLLADGGGDFYVADTKSSMVPVFRHRYDEPDPERVAGSLADFLASAALAYARGVIYVSDGYLEQDENGWRGLLGLP
jgi:hypothetical protein